jgi:hypothetical protein
VLVESCDGSFGGAWAPRALMFPPLQTGGLLRRLKLKETRLLFIHRKGIAGHGRTSQGILQDLFPLPWVGPG